MFNEEPEENTVDGAGDEKKAQIKIDDLGVRFAEQLPERKLSLAEVQGFLLQYKENPEDACLR